MLEEYVFVFLLLYALLIKPCFIMNIDLFLDALKSVFDNQVFFPYIYIKI